MTIDITLTDTLRPLPVIRPERKRTTPKITLVCKGEKAWVSIGGAIRTQMGLDPKQAHRVVVLVSRAQIAVQPAKDAVDPAARPLSTGGRINAPELVAALRLKDGERFEIPVDMEDEMLVGPMPETIFTRVGYLARKQRATSGKVAA